MRVLKLVLISFTLLFIVVTGISLLIPSRVRISRAMNMKAEPVAVMNTIGNANDWSWHPGLDSATAVYKGEATLQSYLADQSARPVYIDIKRKDTAEVVAEFGAARTKPIVNTWKVIGHSGVDSITVQWYIDFHPRWYPWEKFASLLLERSYGSGMEQGLTRIKGRVEN